jgi:hypothetical protein
MAISDAQFLDHANQNNAEFANRQVTLRSSGPPGSLIGLMGWYYLDDSKTPFERYEKTGPLDTDWTLGSSGGGTAPHNHDERYYTQDEVDGIIAGVVQGVRVLGAVPLESPDGSATVFTLPSSDEYMENTLQITVNGLDEGAPVRISNSQFEVNVPALLSGDVLRCYYVKLN